MLLPHTCKTFAGQDLLSCHVLLQAATAVVAFAFAAAVALCFPQHLGKSIDLGCCVGKVRELQICTCGEAQNKEMLSSFWVIDKKFQTTHLNEVKEGAWFFSIDE